MTQFYLTWVNKEASSPINYTNFLQILVSLIPMEKTFVDNKPKATYKVTKLGKKKFSDYVDTLKKILTLK